MTDAQTNLIAQVVVRSSDGTSILDADSGITSGNVAQFAVEPDRIEDAARRLKKRGFTLEARDEHTLSISGSTDLFKDVFGLRSAAPGTGGPPESANVPEDLADLVADVVVPPPPEYFP